ncbi:MAG TPA: hypothetical protein VGP47_10960, partial [Parachlamydiaceae bacterium]|nr:hypothetical protein [Parachlamydiaceae bacterium]
MLSQKSENDSALKEVKRSTLVKIAKVAAVALLTTAIVVTLASIGAACCVVPGGAVLLVPFLVLAIGAGMGGAAIGTAILASPSAKLDKEQMKTFETNKKNLNEAIQLNNEHPITLDSRGKPNGRSFEEFMNKHSSVQGQPTFELKNLDNYTSLYKQNRMENNKALVRADMSDVRKKIGELETKIKSDEDPLSNDELARAQKEHKELSSQLKTLTKELEVDQQFNPEIAAELKMKIAQSKTPQPAASTAQNLPDTPVSVRPDTLQVAVNGSESEISGDEAINDLSFLNSIDASTEDSGLSPLMTMLSRPESRSPRYQLRNNMDRLKNNINELEKLHNKNKIELRAKKEELEGLGLDPHEDDDYHKNWLDNSSVFTNLGNLHELDNDLYAVNSDIDDNKAALAKNEKLISKEELKLSDPAMKQGALDKIKELEGFKAQDSAKLQSNLEKRNQLSADLASFLQIVESNYDLGPVAKPVMLHADIFADEEISTESGELDSDVPVNIPKNSGGRVEDVDEHDLPTSYPSVSGMSPGEEKELFDELDQGIKAGSNSQTETYNTDVEDFDAMIADLKKMPANNGVAQQT